MMNEVATPQKKDFVYELDSNYVWSKFENMLDESIELVERAIKDVCGDVVSVYIRMNEEEEEDFKLILSHLKGDIAHQKDTNASTYRLQTFLLGVYARHYIFKKKWFYKGS